MYRDYVSRSGFNSTAGNNNTSLRPPWAVNNTYVRNSRRTSPASTDGFRSVLGGNVERVERTPEVTHGSRERLRPRTTRNVTRRYGRSTNLTPFDTDLPFYLNIFGYRMPSRGSESGRERERARTEERVLEDRRTELEERGRGDVEPEVPLQKNVLTVLDYNLNIETNTKKHHTDLYACTDGDVDQQLVVRRGQLFILTFTLQRPYDIESDDMMIEFQIGEKPSESDGTYHQLLLDETQPASRMDFQGWGARLAERKGNEVTIAVFIPATAIIGEWNCRMATSLVGSEEQFVYDGIGGIFVLFNPWCPEDQVYFSDDELLLKEYILNEYGCLFEGQADFISCRPWFYAQFRDGMLNACMTILRLAFDLKITSEMGDAVMVARKLSRVLNNSSKDPGILTGNWSVNYSGGVAPSVWRGSFQILNQFMRTKQSVKYAQCFVFSHVFTTVLRALGIPSRSLTNFESAHDTDKTVTIDSYEDEYGNDLPDFKSDSIWNYHCWNDVWINRPDLDLTASSRDRYSGWHAVDSTPQERSDGLFQCGPCPLTAIKHGEIGVGYDSKFIYGEVNGEVCKWMVPSDRSRDLKLIEREPNVVGKNISTKIPNGKISKGTFSPGHREVHEQRLDITSLYKYPEGSEEERQSLKVAVGDGFGARIFQNAAGVGMEIGKLHNLLLGANFEFKVILSNQSSESKQIDLTLGVYPIDYRGERLGWGKIAYQKFEGITLWPNTREVFHLNVFEKFYVEQCDNSMSMMLRAFARVQGEEKPLSKLKKIVLATPVLTVKNVTPAYRIKREQPFTVSVLATNPCSKPMTGCSLHIGGSIEPLPSQGFEEQDGTYYKKIKDIFPNEIRNITFEAMGHKQPLKIGTRELDVDLLSNELPEMSGNLEVELI